jgi:hypothetical protein
MHDVIMGIHKCFESFSSLSYWPRCVLMQAEHLFLLTDLAQVKPNFIKLLVARIICNEWSKTAIEIRVLLLEVIFVKLSLNIFGEVEKPLLMLKKFTFIEPRNVREEQEAKISHLIHDLSRDVL